MEPEGLPIDPNYLDAVERLRELVDGPILRISPTSVAVRSLAGLLSAAAFIALPLLDINNAISARIDIVLGESP